MKKFKAFTLVECIIAMAILGIVSLTMVQVFGIVARLNMSNTVDHTSLTQQMKDVERKMNEHSATPVLATTTNKNFTSPTNDWRPKGSFTNMLNPLPSTPTGSGTASGATYISIKRLQSVSSTAAGGTTVTLDPTNAAHLVDPINGRLNNNPITKTNTITGGQYTYPVDIVSLDLRNGSNGKLSASNPGLEKGAHLSYTFVLPTSPT